MGTIPQFANDYGAAIGRTPVQMGGWRRALRGRGYLKPKAHGKAAEIATDDLAIKLFLATCGADEPINGPAAIESFGRLQPLYVRDTVLEGRDRGQLRWAAHGYAGSEKVFGLGLCDDDPIGMDIMDYVGSTLADAVSLAIGHVRKPSKHCWLPIMFDFNRPPYLPCVDVAFARFPVNGLIFPQHDTSRVAICEYGLTDFSSINRPVFAQDQYRSTMVVPGSIIRTMAALIDDVPLPGVTHAYH